MLHLIWRLRPDTPKAIPAVGPASRGNPTWHLHPTCQRQAGPAPSRHVDHTWHEINGGRRGVLVLRSATSEAGFGWPIGPQNPPPPPDAVARAGALTPWTRARGNKTLENSSTSYTYTPTFSSKWLATRCCQPKKQKNTACIYLPSSAERLVEALVFDRNHENATALWARCGVGDPRPCTAYRVGYILSSHKKVTIDCDSTARDEECDLAIWPVPLAFYFLSFN